MWAVSVGQNQNISKAAAALGFIVLERVFDGVVISLRPFWCWPRWIFFPECCGSIAFLALSAVGLGVGNCEAAPNIFIQDQLILDRAEIRIKRHGSSKRVLGHRHFPDTLKEKRTVIT